MQAPLAAPFHSHVPTPPCPPSAFILQPYRSNLEKTQLKMHVGPGDEGCLEIVYWILPTNEIQRVHTETE